MPDKTVCWEIQCFFFHGKCFNAYYSYIVTFENSLTYLFESSTLIFILSKKENCKMKPKLLCSGVSYRLSQNNRPTEEYRKSLWRRKLWGIEKLRGLNGREKKRSERWFSYSALLLPLRYLLFHRQCQTSKVAELHLQCNGERNHWSSEPTDAFSLDTYLRSERKPEIVKSSLWNQSSKPSLTPVWIN